MKMLLPCAVFLLHIAGACSELFAADSLLNRCTIDSVYFDTATHVIQLSWKIDSIDATPGIEASITVTCGSDMSASPSGAFPIVSLGGDTSLTIPSLRFDTIYTIGIWCRINGHWVPPDSSSFRIIKVPPATWEPVILFPATDTIRVLGNRVLLWHDADYGVNVPQHADTVRIRPVDREKLHGFIAAGPSVYFTNPVPTPPFFIALRYDAVPGAVRSMVRIFRDSCGLMLLERVSGIDTVNRRVWVKTSRNTHPFIPLIDTVRPRIDFQSDTGQPVDSMTSDLVFRVNDNTANVSLHLFSGSGDKTLFTGLPRFSTTLEDTSGRFTWQLSAEGMRETGLRAYLAVSDGAANDTINLSRQVILRRCDERSTVAGTIMPLAATALLDSASARYCLRTLFESAQGNYDKKEFRIYRWFPDAGEAVPNGWLEYAAGRDTLFSFVPGRLFWLISREERIIDFGRGRTPSLKDTFSLSLASKQWTDFSMPYNFNIGLNEALRATGSAGDSLFFYQWIQDTARRTYWAQAVYCPGISSLDSSSATLSYGKSGMYTIYNSSDSKALLRIPPVPAAASATAPPIPVARLRPLDAWCFCITMSAKGTPTSSAYCVASEETASPFFIPPPPAFSEQNIAIRMPGGNGRYGIIKVPFQSDSILLFEVMVTNSSSTKQTVCLSSRRLGGTLEGAFIIRGAAQPRLAPVSVDVDARTTASISFAVGTSGQIGRLAQNQPSAAPGIRAITSLPHGKGLLVAFVPSAGARYILLRVYDLEGRQIAVAGIAASGAQPRRMAIPLKTGARGCYIVKLTELPGKPGAVSEIRKKAFF
jgi:hypothetical protein